MQNPNQFSRMSKLENHNIYLDTDHLYDPLRNALRKSTISPSLVAPNHYLGDKLMNASRITRNMRSLSPADVETIRRSIYIPIDKQLVATHNLQRVKGKRFMAVDMEERVGEALSQDQFSRIRTDNIQQIVYQLKQNGQKNGNNNPTRIIEYPNTMRTQASMNIKNTLMNQPTNLFSAYSDSNELMGSKSQSTFPKYHTGSVNNKGGNQNQSSKIGSISRKLEQESNEPKLYDFRQSNVGSQSSILKLKRNRQNYKYNLFSLLDEVGNNGCQNGGCSGSNEIVASKINNNPWKA